MSVIWVMIPMAIAMAGLAVWAFVRAVKSGQMDDLDTPPIRAVFDDDVPTRQIESDPDQKPEGESR